MPRGRKSKLRARERRQRARAEARARGAQAAAGAEAAGALSVSGGAPPGSPSGAAAGRARGPAPKSKTYPWAAAAGEGAGPDLLAQKAALLVEFLLCQYKAEGPVRRGDMLRVVHKRYRRDFPDILARARERLRLLFGLELQEATPRGGAYLLVDPRGGGGGEGEGEGGGGGRFPRRGVLMPLLSVILLHGDRASEEQMWAFLGRLGVYDGKSDRVCGEPRQRVTRDLVRERYLVPRQVPRSQPPRFEFRWGPRAQAETSKMQVLEFLARLHGTVPAAFAPLYEEALREEEERGRGPPRGARGPKAGGGGGGGGRQGAAPCRYPHPE